MTGHDAYAAAFAVFGLAGAIQNTGAGFVVGVSDSAAARGTETVIFAARHSSQFVVVKLTALFGEIIFGQFKALGRGSSNDLLLGHLAKHRESGWIGRNEFHEFLHMISRV